MSSENQKLWGGRFQEKTAPIMERIGESISFDWKLYQEDLQGSKAHARMLAKMGILKEEELSSILDGLGQIEIEIRQGRLAFRPELEDIHMHVESRLTEIIGDTAKKLHTARSRNDQVCQDVRLFQIHRIQEIQSALESLMESLLEKATVSTNIILPGYTHLQVAQPIRASHYLLSYFWAFRRDYVEFTQAKDSANQVVLGCGALAGVNYQSDRFYLQSELKLDAVSENSIDSVSSRDHVLKFLFACAQTALHLSRISEEIIIYNSQEFRFIRLPDSLTTGSSIMPQKKNPDIAELIRGKSARVLANLNQLMILMKGLPLAYNRDMQEDKFALFDSSEQVLLCLEGMKALVDGIEFLEENTRNSLESGFATATDLADYLVNDCEIPFREAHSLVGKLVQKCVENSKTLSTIEEDFRKEISTHFTGEKYEKAISLEASCDKKVSYGGTSIGRQKEQLQLAGKILKEIKQEIEVDECAKY